MAVPLTFDEVMDGLKSFYKEEYNEELPDLWIKAVDRMMVLALNSHQGPARKLDLFCKDMKAKNLVKMFSIDVPEGILPAGYTATLQDIKVNTRGPDDTIYNNHPNIRKMVARGTTTMQLNGPESWYDVIIYANKKFTGGVGDEDENQPNNDDTWREYCLETPENAKSIVCMEKLNGDAAHFSGRYIAGKFYLFVGSKNTHMLIRNKSHVDLYTGERYAVAKRFAKTVCDTLEKLENSVRRLLYSFLHHTKTTAICEVLQPEYQHLVDLSYLEENELNLIAFTPTAIDEDETTLTAFPPHHTLDIGKVLGLACASYTIINQEDMMSQRDKIRADRHKEGEVLYYLNEKGETFGIAKAKSVWYIYLRALREKVVYAFSTSKKKAGWNLEDRLKSMYKRFDEIQSWLKISEACVTSWKEIGESYTRWLEKELEEKRLDTKEIRPKFPVIWKRFLSESGKDDNIPL